VLKVCVRLGVVELDGADATCQDVPESAQTPTMSCKDTLPLTQVEEVPCQLRIPTTFRECCLTE
jgi:hypothetical protein